MLLPALWNALHFALAPVDTGAAWLWLTSEATPTAHDGTDEMSFFTESATVVKDCAAC